MTYLLAGLITAIYLCYTTEQEKHFFSDKLGIHSLWEAVCNYRVVFAFAIIVILWPIALVKTIYSTFNEE